VTTPQQPVFGAILNRPSNWQRLTASTAGVSAAYLLILAAAIALSKQLPPPPKEAPKKLMVTLFDAPKIAEFRSLGEAGGEDKGAIGAGEETAPIIKAPEAKASRAVTTKAKTPVSTKAIPTETPTSISGAKVQTETPKPSASAGGEAITASAPQATPTPGAAPGAGLPGTGSGGVVGGTGGAGTGTNAGSGGTAGGTGAGSRPGIVSGDTTVLPFMDGMTRPTLLSKVEIEIPREARDANASGLILSKCVIGTDGMLKRCKIIKGIPLLDQAALGALSKMKYSPVIYQGKPVQVEYVIPLKITPQ
jgi:periplasmic protein TonB